MRIALLDVPIDTLTFNQAVEQITALAQDGQRHQIVTINPEMIVEAQGNEAFKQVLTEADLLVPDGVGLMPMAQFVESSKTEHGLLRLFLRWLSYLLSTLFRQQKFTIITERVSGVDLVVALACKAETLGMPVVLIGGNLGEAGEAGERLKQQFPNLDVIVNPGPKNASQETEQEFASLVSQLSGLTSAFLFVAFGHPKQELWINQHQADLPLGVAIGVGGTFTYLSGRKRRAHPIVQTLGLEWLWRLISEPRRFKRIANATIVFPWLVLRSVK